MALSKLAISLIAGIGSVVAVGGITAGVVVSRNNTVVEATNENNESNSKETNKANRSPEKNESSLMENQPLNDSDDKPLVMTMEEESSKKMKQMGEESKEQQDPISHSEDGAAQIDATSNSSHDDSAAPQAETETQKQQPAENTQAQRGEMDARQEPPKPATPPVPSASKQTELSREKSDGQNTISKDVPKAESGSDSVSDEQGEGESQSL